MMKLPIPIPAFKDNYIWLLTEAQSQEAVVIDPGDAAPVLEKLQQSNLRLSACVVTHHHFDHSGGALELMEKTGAKVYGPNSKLFKESMPLKEGESLALFNSSLTFKVLEIPGHTLDHIALISTDLIEGHPLLFCGDTLFTGGCGRVFEGSYGQMLASLQKLKQLPTDTLVYCGHEYTEANLKFAKSVEPDNKDLLARHEQVILTRKSHKPSVPSFLSDELNTNPFLRTDQKSVHLAAEKYAGKPLNTEEQVFATIREWKNDFS